MLTNLSIRNIVLIESLDLEFHDNLTVFTGETGAGKSILMDSLALSLGAKGDSSFVRSGTDLGQVISEFSIIDNNELKQLLKDNDIECEDNIILRRTISKDGKSKAWVNDIPVSIKTLKNIGDLLIEIHGQFENHTLLDSSSHINVLDDFGNLSGLKKQVSDAYTVWKSKVIEKEEFEKHLENIAKEREFLEYNIEELGKINPVKGEEFELDNQRTMMMNSEKNLNIIKDAISNLTLESKGLDSMIFNSARCLERIKLEPNPAEKIINDLYDVGQTISNINAELEQLYRDNVYSESDLESIEERLFALRGLARKHRINVDDLPEFLTKMQSDLNDIDIGNSKLLNLNVEIDKLYNIFLELAKKLSNERKQVASSLKLNLLKELPDLKLANTRFEVDITEHIPSKNGIDDVVFMISTNPGNPLAPLNKIASGGELSRLMLALRVVLSKDNQVKTFVFDEIDTGISGATAEAIGDRLSKLSKYNQVLVITHSAQVAGFANNHFKISKSSENGNTKTNVKQLNNEERINEIARIISGSNISDISLNAAKNLIKN